MFIEQIIEFQLRGPESPDRTRNPKTGYFCDKTKDLRGKSSSELLLTAKNIAEGNAPCFLHLEPVNYKIYPKNARF